MSETGVGLPELPDGWIWTTVGSIGLVASGKTPKGINDLDSEGEIPFYKVNDMNKSGNEKFMRSAEIALDDDQTAGLGIHVREQGTVIFPKRGGAIATNKKRILSCPSAYDLNIMGVLPYIVPTDFFYQWLLSIDLAALSDGSNVPQLNHKDIDPLPFPLPPLPEHHRIVAKIEELFTKLDTGINELHKAQSQLKRYRQSVLKAAFEGKLTEAWRAEHQGGIKPVSPITGDLPNGWVWTTVKSAIKKVSLGGKKLKQKNYEEVGKLPVIDQGLSFIGGYTNREELKVECQLPIIVFGDHTKAFKYVDFDFVAGADGIKVMQPQEMYDPKLFYYFVQATSLPEKGYARHFQFLEKALIPLPPLAEQQAIVSEVESRLSVADEVEKTVTAELKRAEQLRQSILKKAFSGQLVPQDPNDEPASILLEQIKIQKEIVF